MGSNIAQLEMMSRNIFQACRLLVDSYHPGFSVTARVAYSTALRNLHYLRKEIDAMIKVDEVEKDGKNDDSG